jgi:hypothetical protein
LLVGFTPFSLPDFTPPVSIGLIIYLPFTSLASAHALYSTSHTLSSLLHVWFCEFISILNPFHHGNYTCLQCAMIRKSIGWGTLTPWKST